MTLDITHKKWVQMTHGTRGGCRIFPHRTIGAFFADWGDGVLPIKKGGAIVMGDPQARWMVYGKSHDDRGSTISGNL